MDDPTMWDERYWPDGLHLYAINELIWEAAAERLRTPPAGLTTACRDGSAAERGRQRRELAERDATIYSLADRRRTSVPSHGPAAA